MVEQEKVIKLFITTDDVSNEKGDYHYMVNGMDNLFSVIDLLTFNGYDSIYVHLNSPIGLDEVNQNLIKLCDLFKAKGLSSANYCRMGLPLEGGRFNTTIGENNMLTKERYMITFR